MSKNITIQELDLNKIRPNAESMKTAVGGSKITIIGKPGTGKSMLIKHLLYSKKHLIPVGTVFSGTEDTNSFYSDIFPDLFIYEQYNEEAVNNIFKCQKIKKKYNIPNPWSVFIMDDCMDDIKIFNKPLFAGFFKNSRHWNMFSIFANQYVFDFKPSIRSSIDGIFIFREPNVINREKLYKNFASIIPSFCIFNKLMDHLTNDYTSIYIDNQTQSNNWEECVFYFKADYVPSFKFGCDDYWKFAETRQQPKSELDFDL
jgi:hypothetical protein